MYQCWRKDMFVAVIKLRRHESKEFDYAMYWCKESYEEPFQHFK